MQALRESTLIGGLVAQIERKVPFPFRRGATFFEHDHFLHDLSALAKPVMLGEAVDGDVLGGRGGLVFAEILKEVVEGVLALGGKYDELAAEAVLEAILGRDGFSVVGGGNSGVLRVFATKSWAGAATTEFLASLRARRSSARRIRRDVICHCFRIGGERKAEFFS